MSTTISAQTLGFVLRQNPDAHPSIKIEVPEELRARLVAMPEPTPDPVAVKRCIVYRADSLDATFAAAMLVDAIGHNETVSLIPVTNDIPYDRLQQFGHAMLLGLPEISMAYMDKVRESGKRVVTVFAYQGDHPDIDAVPEQAVKGLFKKTPAPVAQWRNRLAVCRPDTDSYGPIADAAGNTMISLAYSWIVEHELSTVAYVINQLRAFASRYVSLAPSVTDEFAKDSFGVGLRAKDETVNKARLFNLIPKLVQAMKADRAVVAIRALDLNDDTDGYMHYWSDCFTTFARSSQNELYRLRNPRGLGIVGAKARAKKEALGQSRRRSFTTTVPTMACTERQHLDMLCIAMMHNNAFVSYEDMHGLRLYRVYAKDRALANALVHSLEGEKVWSDGLGLRTYTRLPR